MNENNEILLSFDSLRLGYGTKVLLPPVSAAAARGELVAVIGRNGIGKSTLLRTLLGLQPALGGKILIGGRDLKELSGIQKARRIGYISTEMVRVSNMTVFDLVTFGRFPHTNWIGRIDKDSCLAVNDAILKTGLGGFEKRYISSLSDGERQRAMIARILAQDTDILIMDEPTAFLDIVNKFDIIKLMLSLSKEGKTIIFSTHDLSIAVNQADKIWMMLEDKIVEGAPEDLALDGSFGSLFKSATVSFDTNEGTFKLKTESYNSIFIEGEGGIYNWTRKALGRIGWSVSSVPTEPYIIVPSTGRGKWILEFQEKQQCFDNLYDLTRSFKAGFRIDHL